MVAWHDGLVDAFPVPSDEVVVAVDPAADPSAIVAEEEEKADQLLADSSPFTFFSLPSELRNRVYYLVLFTKPPYAISTKTRPASRTAIFQASSRFHDEAAYVFYTSQTFRIFAIQDFTPMPTIRQLPARYRRLLTDVEMILGESWTDPPKSWRVTKPMAKCLAEIKAIHTLRVFVKMDPSLPFFAKYKKFRVSMSFYTDFCGDLLRDVLAAMPKLQCVLLDGSPSVDRNGPLLSRLRREAEAKNKLIKWGNEGSWTPIWLDGLELT